MQRIEKIFRRCGKYIDNLARVKDLKCVELEAPENGLFSAADMLDINTEPASGSKIKKAVNSVLPLIPYYKDFAPETNLRRDLLAELGFNLGYSPFSDKEITAVYFAQLFDGGKRLGEDLKDASEIIVQKLGFGIKIGPASIEHCQNILRERVAVARSFYIGENGTWISAFLDGLQDDISRLSFLNFLSQRIFSKVLFDNDICIPVQPPAATKEWRNQREATSIEVPKLFDVKGEPLKDIHFTHVYTYQQYCVPGQVEPGQGDTVVDAGAFVGDTASWFSQMVGNTGRVHAFEPSPGNFERGRENMELNGFSNVVFHNYGLSDIKGMAAININPVWGSADKIKYDEEGEIPLISLDAALNERVDFIKSDIEGNELALLRGARETILRDAPVLAICLYHKRDDFWQIPQYISELRPDYKFWFRCEAEPVLFAKSDQKK